MNKHCFHISLLLLGLSSAASAQFVKGNEAVSAERPGNPELPPTQRARSKVCIAGEQCLNHTWHMVETSSGLQECTEPYARPGACRASSYGSTKLSRLWVVKANGVWLHCQYPDLASKCVSIFARPPANLPYPAYQ